MDPASKLVGLQIYHLEGKNGDRATTMTPYIDVKVVCYFRGKELTLFESKGYDNFGSSCRDPGETYNAANIWLADFIAFFGSTFSKVRDKHFRMQTITTMVETEG